LAVRPQSPEELDELHRFVAGAAAETVQHRRRIDVAVGLWELLQLSGVRLEDADFKLFWRMRGWPSRLRKVCPSTLACFQVSRLGSRYVGFGAQTANKICQSA
jgi:hypothetical protein